MNNFKQRDGILTGTTIPGQVNLRLIEIKGYSIPPRSLKLQPHYQIQFSVIPRISFFLDEEGSYRSEGGTVSVL